MLLVKHAICISMKIMINGLSCLIHNKFTDVLSFIRQYNIPAKLEYVKMLQCIEENGMCLCELGLYQDSLRDSGHYYVPFFKSYRPPG